MDTVLEHSCPFVHAGVFTWGETRGGRKVLRWLIWVLGGKIGAIHQTPRLTNANAGQTNKGFIYKAANQET